MTVSISSILYAIYTELSRRWRGGRPGEVSCGIPEISCRPRISMKRMSDMWRARWRMECGRMYEGTALRHAHRYLSVGFLTFVR